MGKLGSLTIARTVGRVFAFSAVFFLPTCAEEDHWETADSISCSIEDPVRDSFLTVPIFTLLRLGLTGEGLEFKEIETYGRCSVLSTEVNRRMVDPLLGMLVGVSSFGAS